MSRLLRFTCLLLVAVVPLSAQGIPEPADYFGFEIGEDRKLADWEQLTGWYELLAARSDRVILDTLGETTWGLPYVMLTVTSSDNHARLDELREIQNRHHAVFIKIRGVMLTRQFAGQDNSTVASWTVEDTLFRHINRRHSTRRCRNPSAIAPHARRAHPTGGPNDILEYQARRYGPHRSSHRVSSERDGDVGCRTPIAHPYYDEFLYDDGTGRNQWLKKSHRHAVDRVTKPQPVAGREIAEPNDFRRKQDSVFEALYRRSKTTDRYEQRIQHRSRR